MLRSYGLAQAQLGYAYMTGSGVAQDYRVAARWLTEAARQGEPYAQLNLGTMYEDGSGVDRNISQARALYAQAARSPVPQVAARARQLMAALPDSSDQRSPGHSDSSSDVNALIGVAAAVVVGATLISLLSRSSSGDSAAGPPGDGSSSVGGAVGSDGAWGGGSSSSSAPQPHCHVAPADDPFTAKNGSDAISPRGATTLVCD